MRFRQLLNEHPELLAFFVKEIDATNDYSMNEFKKDSLTFELYADADEVREEIIKKNAGYKVLSNLLNADRAARSIELERSMLSLYSVGVITHKDFDFFNDLAPVYGTKITQEQLTLWNTLTTQLFPSLPSEEKRDSLTKNQTPDWQKILRTALVLGDIGKIKPLRISLSQELGINEQDPDQFLESLLNKGYLKLLSLFPSIAALTKMEFEYLHAIHTGFHFGHFIHAECDHIPLEPLSRSIRLHGIEWFQRNLILQLFDVAGAAAQQSRMLLNQDIFHTYVGLILPLLSKLEKETAVTIYENYLASRLESASIKVTYVSDNVLSNESYWLGRFICMFRISKPKEAEELQTAFKQLLSEKSFSDDLSILKDYQQERFPTPTYMPAFLNALKSNSNISTLALQSKETAQCIALRVGMRLIARSIQTQKTLLQRGLIKKPQPLNFNFLTGLVKTDLDLIKYLYESNNPANISLGKMDGAVVPISKLAESQIENYYCYPIARPNSQRQTDKKQEIKETSNSTYYQLMATDSFSLPQKLNMNSNLEHALEYLGFNKKHFQLFDEYGYLYREVSQEEKIEAFFSNLYIGEYLSDEIFKQCVNYLAAEKAFNIAENHNIVQDLIQARKSAEHSGSFNVNTFLVALSGCKYFSAEDFVDVVVFLSQTAFGRKFGEERHTVKASTSLEEKADIFFDNCEAFGIVTPHPLHPLTEEKADLVIIPGASYPRGVIRFDYFEKNLILGKKTECYTGERELCAELDGDSDLEKGKEIILRVANHFNMKHHNTFNFDEKTNQTKLKMAVNERPVTETLLFQCLLEQRKKTSVQLISSDIETDHWRATTVTNAKDRANDLIKRILAGDLKNRTEINIIAIIEQPFTMRMAMQFSQIINAKFKEQKINIPVRVIPTGPGFDRYKWSMMQPKKRSNWLGVFNSDLAAGLSQKYQEYRAQHKDPSKLRREESLVFSKRLQIFEANQKKQENTISQTVSNERTNSVPLKEQPNDNQKALKLTI